MKDGVVVPDAAVAVALLPSVLLAHVVNLNQAVARGVLSIE